MKLKIIQRKKFRIRNKLKKYSANDRYIMYQEAEKIFLAK